MVSFFLPNVSYPILKARNLRYCKRNFNLYRTTENEKLEANALYLYGLAKTWYHSLVLSRGMMTWTEFKEELCDRFCLEYFDDFVYEFNSI